jgi:transposase
MMLVRQRTQLKNRIHATLSKYAIVIDEVSDIFGKKGRRLMSEKMVQLPPETLYATEVVLQQMDVVEEQIIAMEKRMGQIQEETAEIGLLKSIPGIGDILSTVIAFEVGDIGRFPSAEHMASYAGTTPRIHSSGGKARFGQVRSDVNRYLKWAFMEAANVISRSQHYMGQRHVVKLYKRLREKKGHQKAIGAVARHLAEATFWVLTKKELYREPKAISSNKV